MAIKIYSFIFVHVDFDVNWWWVNGNMIIGPFSLGSIEILIQ